MINDGYLNESEILSLSNKRPYKAVQDLDTRNLLVELVLENRLHNKNHKAYQSVIEALASSPQRDAIFNTLIKQSHAFKAKLLLDASNKGVKLPANYSNSFHSIRNIIDEVIHTIYCAEHESWFGLDATTKEREKFSSEFQSTVTKLNAMLKKLIIDEDYWPDELESAISAFDNMQIKKVQAFNIAQHGEDSIMHSEHKNSEILNHYGIAASTTEERLQIYAYGISEWAKTKPLALRSGNAEVIRLRLIRALTRHFRFKFNTPLRSTVCAITNALHKNTNLSVSDIAKLAP